MVVNGYGGVIMEPVAHFNLNKYLGKWYEIARLPAWFEKNLINVTAEYSIKENGRIKVENSGIDSTTMKMKTSVGKAKVAKTANLGYLKVSFFGPFYGDYMVLDLDNDYQYAMVASSKKYLWILSRTPQLSKETLDRLLEKAKNLGFETDKLFFTPQTK